MASAGKRKTTVAKLQRESRLRERRAAKEAKKAARKLAAFESPPADTYESEPAEPGDAPVS